VLIGLAAKAVQKVNPEGTLSDEGKKNIEVLYSEILSRRWGILKLYIGCTSEKMDEFENDILEFLRSQSRNSSTIWRQTFYFEFKIHAIELLARRLAEISSFKDIKERLDFSSDDEDEYEAKEAEATSISMPPEESEAEVEGYVHPSNGLEPSAPPKEGLMG
jgi:hypothetical protein